MRYKILFLILSTALLSACAKKEETRRTGFLVRGVIHNIGSNRAISLQEITNSGLVLLDSTAVDRNDSFELNGSVNEKLFCTLRLPKGDVLLVIDSNSDLTLNIDADTLERYTVHGSAENEEMRKLFLLNSAFMQHARALEAKFAAYGDNVPPVSVQSQIRSEFDSIQRAHKAAIRQFVTGLDNSLVPYFATNFLSPEADFEFFDAVDKKFNSRFSSSKYAIALHQRVEDLRRTAPGATAPDIVLNDPFGKTIALSSLRGKYVLLDFWASWCKPCRDENPHVVEVFNKYKAKGFDVFSVSLDDNREAWTAAINKDNLLWNHVSDLMKWNSPVVKQFSIEAIPFTLLLDKEGKIMDKNLRGEALDAKLKELFGY